LRVKASTTLWIIATALLLTGGCGNCCESCRRHTQMIEHHKHVDRTLAERPHEAAIERAIVSQHTLFPYHFVPNSPMLNELGVRDLDVLATHYRYNPGRLHVRRGEAPEELYRQRLRNVLNLLESTGVNVESLAVSDGPAGGETIPSEQMLHILIKDVHQTPPSFYRQPAGAGISGGER
jgi:hypothetical protein